MRKPRIGYVPQSLNIDSRLTRDGVRYAVVVFVGSSAFLHAAEKAGRSTARASEALFSDMLLDKPVGRLSGGELQQVLLAVATLPKPDLLILDEPVSGVDQAGLAQFYKTVDRLKATDDMVILLVSHDLDYVRRHADRVVLGPRGGGVRRSETVFASKAFRSAFPEKEGDGICLTRCSAGGSMIYAQRFCRGTADHAAVCRCSVRWWSTTAWRSFRMRWGIPRSPAWGIGVLLGFTDTNLVMIAFAVVFALLMNRIRHSGCPRPTWSSGVLVLRRSAGVGYPLPGQHFSKYQNLLIRGYSEHFRGEFVELAGALVVVVLLWLLCSTACMR